MRLLVLAPLLALLSACGGDDDDALPVDGGTAPDTGSMSGTPAAGKATMTATFSDPVNGYSGHLTPFTGLEDGSECKSVGTGISFNTYTANGMTRRDNVYVTLGNTTLAAGMTYPVPYDLLMGKGITYQELVGTSISTWKCPGSLTFDSIVGKVHRFHFTGTCTPNGGGSVGGMTITGTGVGTLP